MKKQVMDARELLVSRRPVQEMIFFGSICRLIMIRKSLTELKKAAYKIQSDSEVLLVIGIGGSYLGARAAIEFFRTQLL